MIWGWKVGQLRGVSEGEAKMVRVLHEQERAAEGDEGPWERHLSRCAAPCCPEEHHQEMVGHTPGLRAWEPWGPLDAAAWAAGMMGAGRAWSWGRRVAQQPSR